LKSLVRKDVTVGRGKKQREKGTGERKGGACLNARRRLVGNRNRLMGGQRKVAKLIRLLLFMDIPVDEKIREVGP